ncbi:AAA-domain-containing protein [Polychytrium aggregatum]|uniref:AAA-domain-containing protein n=1 Tax=Polychytrium aggregatum TaxID=110093 RepID=UPI0022FE3D3E|nr:AAA-domain-containing protein [Polychytrium aggregatum]KAI9207620.1 AAA-domain-containing protein [Polychytrium aggregatum]
MPQNQPIKIPVLEIALFALSQVALYYGVKWALGALDPFKQKKDAAKAKREKVFGRLGIKNMELTEHEEIIGSEVVHPDDISVTFKDIGGLDLIIDSLRETVIYPLCYPQLFSSNSSLLGAPKGVLLYGPPGCGKTMLAKALAKESGATFINLHVSTLTEKWFGESQKLVHALFSLAKKLEPTIIFIDEIDSFLRERTSSDHEATSMMKAEFMSLWDGLASGQNSRVLVLGATNRPNDIDKAILRRMPKRFSIRLPDDVQRLRVLTLLLKNADVAADFDVQALVPLTAGFSCSDLKELCRNAAMVPIREVLRDLPGPIQGVDAKSLHVRPLSNADFFLSDEYSTQPKPSSSNTGSLTDIPDLD